VRIYVLKFAVAQTEDVSRRTFRRIDLVDKSKAPLFLSKNYFYAGSHLNKLHPPTIDLSPFLHPLFSPRTSFLCLLYDQMQSGTWRSMRPHLQQRGQLMELWPHNPGAFKNQQDPY
jgi:hypothetical protein